MMNCLKLSMSMLAALACVPAAMAAPTPVIGSDLAQFSVFGGIGGVTNAPTMYGNPKAPTTLSGLLGTTNTTDTGITGFYGARNNEASGIVAGYSGSGVASGNPAIHQADALANSAYDELKAAQATLEAMRTAGITEYGDLSGLTLTPGIYSLSAPAYNLGVGQKLILNGAGFFNPQWVFLATSSIIMDTDSVVSLINADEGASVYWDAVSSITINAGASLVGNFLAQTSITMGANANIGCGRALDGSLAGGGDVTLISNNIVSSNCANGSVSGLNGPTAGSAVPEPASYTLVFAGMGVMGFLSRRRKA